MEKDPLPLLLFSRRDGIGLFKGALSIPTSNRLVSPLGKGRDYKAESIVAIKHCFAVVGGEGEKRGEGDSSVLHLISPSVSKIQRPGGWGSSRWENSSKPRNLPFHSCPLLLHTFPLSVPFSHLFYLAGYCAVDGNPCVQGCARVLEDGNVVSVH